MGNNVEKSTYPCIIVKESQLEYARFNYANANAMLYELAELCHSPLRGEKDVKVAMVTILCEIGVIASRENNRKLHTMLKGIAGLAFLAREDFVWRRVERRILRAKAMLEGRREKDFELPEYSGKIAIDEDAANDYAERNKVIREVMRLIHSPIPYHYLKRLLNSTLRKLYEAAPDGSFFKERLQSALSCISAKNCVKEQDLVQMEDFLEAATMVLY